MRRLLGLPALTLSCLVMLSACDRPATTAPASETVDVGAAARASAAHGADAPGAAAAVPFRATISDDDPCTAVVDPEEHRVTFRGTSYVQELPNGNQVIRTRYAITTDSGYEGRGVRVEVANGSVQRAHFNDMLTHPDGRKFRAHAVQVVDLKTDPPTIRVLKISGLTCLGS